MTRVLVSQRVVVGPHGDRRDALEHTYVTLLESCGVEVIPVSNVTTRVSALCDLADGVVLTGGNDVGTDGDRDRTESAIITEAIRRRLPVLGLCRGLQFINVHFGGALVDLTTHPSWDRHRPGCHHLVRPLGAMAVEVVGAAPFEVNSYHQQGVVAATLAPVLRCFIQDDGTDIVEGLFHPALPIAAVQYHPERRVEQTPADTRLMEAFVRQQGFWTCR